MADGPSSRACPECGESNDAAVREYANCGGALPAIEPARPPRLAAFWFAWALVTLVFHGLGSWVVMNFFPMALFPDSGTGGMALSMAAGTSAGCFTGWAQYAVLRIRIPGRSWLPWVWLTSLGYGLGTMVVDIALEGAFQAGEGSVTAPALMAGAVCGLILGTLQFGLLTRWFPGTPWWPWIVVNVAAWALLYGAFGAWLDEDYAAWIDWASAVPLALVTGVGMEAMLRRAFRRTPSR